MLSNTINGATGYGGAYIRYVWSATQSIPNNTSTISVNLYLVLPSGMSTYATETGNIYIDGAGSSYNNGTQSRSAGVSWLASYSRTIDHNADGTKTFSFSGQFTSGWSTLGTLSVSGSQTLDAIPRQANITSAPNFNDEENPTVGYSNPAGNSVSELKIAIYNTAGTVAYAGYRDAVKTGTSYTFNLTSDERTALRSASANSNSMTVRFYLRTYLGGVYYYSLLDRTMTIVNGSPTFAGNYTYRDSNSTTSTVTGNNQYFIQGLSTLELTLLSANKAVANKNATMTKYNASISSINQDITYTTSDIIQSLGTIGANGTTNLVVSAIDSRINTTSVSKSVNVLPYEVPQVTATCSRVNNFETSTLFRISGVVSRLTIASVDKNTVNTSTGVQYRYKKVSDVTWSSWVNKTSATSSGNVSVTDFNVDLDRNFAWNVQVKITDKLASTTVDILVSVGIPIFRIGTDGKIYNNEVQVMPMIDEDNFASNLDTRVPTQQSVKSYVDLKSRKAFMSIRYNTSPYTMSWATAWTGIKVPLDTIDTVYDPNGLLSLSNGGIKIGAGVSRVRITGVFAFYNNSGIRADYVPQILLNGTGLGTFAYENAHQDYVAYISTPLKTISIPVVQNDIIYMYCSMGGTGNRSIFNHTTLTVEVMA